MTIWLVRHGESELNAAGIRHRRENTPLTSHGIKQAADIRCKDVRLVTSPLLRAYGTACIIAATNGLDAPQVIDELAERDWGQTCEDAAKPAAEALRKLDGNILAITHGGILKGLLGMERTPHNGSLHRWSP